LYPLENRYLQTASYTKIKGEWHGGRT